MLNFFSMRYVCYANIWGKSKKNNWDDMEIFHGKLVGLMSRANAYFLCVLWKGKHMLYKNNITAQLCRIGESIRFVIGVRSKSALMCKPSQTFK